MRGSVVRYDASKGYAFVATDGLDEDVFLHVNDLDFDKALLAVGTVVDVDYEVSDRGPRALAASLVSSPVADAAQAALGGAARESSASSSATADPAPHDGFADVLSAAELRTELTERLLLAAGDLTGTQVLAVRRAVEQVARGHGWLDG